MSETGEMYGQEWIAWRDRVDSLSLTEQMHGAGWMEEFQAAPRTASVARDWWCLITHYMRSEDLSVHQAADRSHEEIIRAWRLVGVGDLTYLGAIALSRSTCLGVLNFAHGMLTDSASEKVRPCLAWADSLFI